MAMCFAILGLKIKGHSHQESFLREKNVSEFFPKAGGPAPSGLGAAILDARTARPLREAELFAD
jgi:hypothetical protein